MNKKQDGRLEISPHFRRNHLPGLYFISSNLGKKGGQFTVPHPFS